MSDSFNTLLGPYANASRTCYYQLAKYNKQPKSTVEIKKVREILSEAAFAFICLNYINEVMAENLNDDIDFFLSKSELQKTESELLFYILGSENIEWVKIKNRQTNDKTKQLQLNAMLEIIIREDYRKKWLEIFSRRLRTIDNMQAYFENNIIVEELDDAQSMKSRAFFSSQFTIKFI